MKKNIIIIILFLFITSINCHSQPQRLINIEYLPQYYKERGILFSKDYDPHIVIKNLKYRYTPTVEDIRDAELILVKKYDSLENSTVDVKTFYSKWVRHYIGFVDSNDNKNIIVQLINNSNRKKVKKLLGDNWEDRFIGMYSDSFYKISIILRININERSISYDL
jgi:hypothetical protein